MALFYLHIIFHEWNIINSETGKELAHTVYVFSGILGERISGKQGKCIDTCDFRSAKMLVGVPPNPMDFWPY